MSIVNSVFVKDTYLQKDGRRFVNEIHTDHLGNTYPTTYLAAGNASNATLTAIMNARAVTLADTLAKQEIEEVLNGIGT